MLVRGHLIAQGPAAPPDAVRATMLKLANSLAQGVTGARPEVAAGAGRGAERGCEPASEDAGLGRPGATSPRTPISRTACSTTSSSRPGRRSCSSTTTRSRQASRRSRSRTARRLLDALVVAGALDLEAFAANTSLVDPVVGEARPYPGLVATISRVRALLEGSYLWEAPPRNLQDPLTFRTLPHVLGAAFDALAYVRGVLAVELNAHQGNPIVSADAARVVPAGNFDAVPLAAALDFLRIALAPALTNAAERGLKLLQASQTGLPEGLAAKPHLAEPALSELGTRDPGHRRRGAAARSARVVRAGVDHPARGHRGPDDDGASRGAQARRDGRQLGARVAAIELTIAAQAVDLRGRPALGAGSGRAYELVRGQVPFTDAGETLPPDLEPVVELVRSGALVD